mmetsp:Transcript_123106/g.359455  ORF Transcript_123106/g.359455 Transcript_123106/m.359455 type:complete len:319 (+) Transcript_123106:264-1220(+)
MQLVSIHDVLGLAGQNRRNVLAGRVHQFLPRLQALPADVRADDEVGRGEERAVRGHGLRLLGIQGGARDGASLELFDDVLLLHDGPAGAVDDVGGLLHHLDPLRVDQVLRRGEERAVQADEVALRQELLKGDPLHVLPLSREGVVDQDAHAEGKRDVHHGLADAATADDPHHFSLHLHMGQVVHHLATAADHPCREAVLVAFQEPLLQLEHRAGEVQRIGDGQGGNCLVAVRGHVAHDEAPFLRSGDVDVIVASAGLTYALDGVGELLDEIGTDGQLLGHEDLSALRPLQDLLLGAIVVPLHLRNRFQLRPTGASIVL